MRMYKIGDLCTLYLGHEVDNRTKTVRIDCTDWLERCPQLTQYRIEVTNPAGLVYLPVTTFEAGVLSWAITDGDTATPGKGLYQIVATGANGERKTSDTHTVYVVSNMPGTAGDTPPEASQPWVDEVVSAAERAEDAAERAESAAAGGVPVATPDKAGVVKPGEGLEVEADGTLNVVGGGGGGITQETDPTVPSWAKQPNKPSYTPQEIGAQPAGDYALKSDIPAPYILPTATADTLGGVKVGEGLQMDGDVLEVVSEDYELIETFTLEEDMAVERTQEPSGLAYNMRAIFIGLSAPSTVSAGNIRVAATLKNSWETLHTFILGLKQTEYAKRGALEFTAIDGLWRCRTYQMISSDGGYQSVYNNGSFEGWYNLKDNGSIKKISTGTLPAGLTIKIWGVRADA